MKLLPVVILAFLARTALAAPSFLNWTNSSPYLFYDLTGSAAGASQWVVGLFATLTNTNTLVAHQPRCVYSMWAAISSDSNYIWRSNVTPIDGPGSGLISASIQGIGGAGNTEYYYGVMWPSSYSTPTAAAAAHAPLGVTMLGNNSSTVLATSPGGATFGSAPHIILPTYATNQTLCDPGQLTWN